MRWPGICVRPRARAAVITPSPARIVPSCADHDVPVNPVRGDALLQVFNLVGGMRAVIAGMGVQLGEGEQHEPTA